jgi:hypothetical protein
VIVHQPGEARESQSPPTSFRGVSIVKPIEAARALVSVSELAERLSGAAGVRAGREELFLCPLHDDHNPSLRVDPHKGLWYCDPCALGGDVVELARRRGDTLTTDEDQPGPPHTYFSSSGTTHRSGHRPGIASRTDNATPERL